MSKTTVHKVQVIDKVARTRVGGGGITNVILGDGEVVTFGGGAAQYVAGELPPEVADSPLLIIEESSAKEAEQAGAAVMELGAAMKADRVQKEGDKAKAPATREELAALKYQERKSLASDLGLDTSGKDPVLEARIAEQLFGPADGDEGGKGEEGGEEEKAEG